MLSSAPEKNHRDYGGRFEVNGATTMAYHVDMRGMRGPPDLFDCPHWPNLVVGDIMLKRAPNGWISLHLSNRGSNRWQLLLEVEGRAD